MVLVLFKDYSVISWGLTKVKAQSKSSLPMRYPQTFLGRRQNIIVTHWASVLYPNILQYWDLQLSHTFTFCALGTLFFLHSNAQAWPEQQLFQPGEKCQLELRGITRSGSKKSCPTSREQRETHTRLAPHISPEAAWEGRGTRIIWRQNFWERDTTECR